MAITIPETMPEDWFGEAEADLGNIANDPDLRQAMEAAYQDGLEEMAVDHIVGRLKDRCMAAANPTNHHFTAEPVEAGTETT